jgi:hypothetical protein
MSKMMTQWLQKAKPGDKGMTRPPTSVCVSEHKNEVRSIARGFFQIQFRAPAYKHVGRPTQNSQKRDTPLEKVTNVFMEQYTLPTDTNEIPNLPSRGGVGGGGAGGGGGGRGGVGGGGSGGGEGRGK